MAAMLGDREMALEDKTFDRMFTSRQPQSTQEAPQRAQQPIQCLLVPPQPHFNPMFQQ